MTNNEKEIINNNFIEAELARCDKYGYLKFAGRALSGQDKGKFSLSEAEKAISIDIKGMGYKTHGGHPIVKGGTHDDTRIFKRNEQGNLQEKHNRDIPAELAEIYELAEAKKKEVLGK